MMQPNPKFKNRKPSGLARTSRIFCNGLAQAAIFLVENQYQAFSIWLCDP